MPRLRTMLFLCRWNRPHSARRNHRSQRVPCTLQLFWVPQERVHVSEWGECAQTQWASYVHAAAGNENMWAPVADLRNWQPSWVQFTCCCNRRSLRHATPTEAGYLSSV